MAEKKPVDLGPYQPAAYQKADVAAIQGLLRGDASPEQQVRAIMWIINSAAVTYDMSARPSDPYGTYFAEGRRAVGNQIVKLTKLKIGDMHE